MPADGLEIKQLISSALRLGFSVSEAVQKALGYSLSEFARRKGFRPNEVSMALTGYQGRVYPEIRDAICADLRIPREYLDGLIEAQSEAAEGAA